LYQAEQGHCVSIDISRTSNITGKIDEYAKHVTLVTLVTV